MTEDLGKSLSTLNLKIDELGKIIDKDKLHREELLKTVKILSMKLDNLEDNIKEKNIYHTNMLTYVVGAFAGGLIMGISLFKRARDY